MKKITTLILFGICIFSNAQQKLLFNYDTSGNQILRELCLSGCDPSAKSTNDKAIEDLKEEDLLKFSSEDVLSYYPNPVKEEMYLQWKLEDNIYVNSIQIFSMTGQLLKSYAQTSQKNSQNIPFQDYPTGVYAVLLYYNNGDQKSIKIIKK
jgi:hypothetical protein